MVNKILPLALILVVIGTVLWMINQNDSAVIDTIETKKESEIASNGISMTVYKSPYCGCCGKWGSYMEDKGYNISLINESDMSSIKERFDVPYELESCHTTEIEGYVVEGHIPNEAIEKLLEEKPNIKGIGMAGMPSGSPGMPGPKEEFLIYEINHDGTKGDLFMEL